MTRRYRLLARSLALSAILLVIALVTTFHPIRAQEGSAFDVFLDPTQPFLYFVDLQTGLSRTVTADGSQFALLTNGVLFQERGNGAAWISTPDGQTTPLTWIDAASEHVTVQWVASADRKRIAWATTQQIGSAVTSDLYIALADGSAKKLALHTSSTQGIDLLPLTLTDDGATLFYTRQSFTAASSYELFPVAADIFRLDVATGVASELRGEPDCACAAAVSSDGRLLLHLEPNVDPATGQKLGFKAHWWLLNGGDTLAPAPSLAQSQAGDIVLSRDDNIVVYTSARGILPTKAAPERYVLVVIDLTRREQRILTDPMPDHLRPIAFTGGDRAVLVIDADKGGTYKLSISDGTLTQVSADTFLGRIMTTP